MLWTQNASRSNLPPKFFRETLRSQNQCEIEAIPALVCDTAPAQVCAAAAQVCADGPQVCADGPQVCAKSVNVALWNQAMKAVGVPEAKWADARG